MLLRDLVTPDLIKELTKSIRGEYENDAIFVYGVYSFEDSPTERVVLETAFEGIDIDDFNTKILSTVWEDDRLDEKSLHSALANAWYRNDDYTWSLSFGDDLIFTVILPTKRIADSLFSDFMADLDKKFDPKGTRLASRTANWLKSGDMDSIKASWEQYCGKLTTDMTLNELKGMAKALGLKNYHKLRKQELCNAIGTLIAIQENTGMHPKNLVDLDIIN